MTALEDRHGIHKPLESELPATSSASALGIRFTAPGGLRAGTVLWGGLETEGNASPGTAGGSGHWGAAWGWAGGHWGGAGRAQPLQ